MKKLPFLMIALFVSGTASSQINSAENQRINTERYRAAVSNQHAVDALSSMKRSADESKENNSNAKYLSDHLELLFLKKEKLEKSKTKNVSTLEKLEKTLLKEKNSEDAEITEGKIKRLKAEQIKIPQEIKKIDEEILIFQKKYREALAAQENKS